MSVIVIRRCSLSVEICNHTRKINDSLRMDFGHFADIEDGAANEFSVIVDGLPMLQRTDASLPAVEEVESAIQNSDESPFAPVQGSAIPEYHAALQACLEGRFTAELRALFQTPLRERVPWGLFPTWAHPFDPVEGGHEGGRI